MASMLVVTDFSCVYYQEGDSIGKLLAYYALLPYILILYHASRFYTRREIHEGIIFSGLVLNEGIARALKHALKHPRPALYCSQLRLCDSYGMPSSHTSCVAFGFMLHLLSFVRQYDRKSFGTRLCEACEVAVLAIGTALTAASRVYLGYHAIEQVLAGGALGMAMGAACYSVLGWRCWDCITRTRIGRMLHLKTTLNVADPLSEEATWYRGDGRKKMQ